MCRETHSTIRPQPRVAPYGVQKISPNLSNASDFRACARSALAYLRQRMGLELWMLTRVEGNDWIVLEVLDDGFAINTGQVLKWDESLCSRMLDGRGPRIAADVGAEPALREAPIARQFNVGAYAGVPLVLEDGHLFGTLCGMSRTPMGKEPTAEAATLELIGQLLSSLVQAELRAGRAARQAERYREQALTDVLTGLHNRRGWDLLLAAEEERCALYGYAVAVLIMDLDELKRVNDEQGHAAGDEMLRRAAAVLEAHARENDIIARLGGDEFGLIVTAMQADGLDALVLRFREAFERAGVMVSIGAALRHNIGGLREAWSQADALMYMEKRAETAEAAAGS